MGRSKRDLNERQEDICKILYDYLLHSKNYKEYCTLVTVGEKTFGSPRITRTPITDKFPFTFNTYTIFGDVYKESFESWWYRYGFYLMTYKIKNKKEYRTPALNKSTNLTPQDEPLFSFSHVQPKCIKNYLDIYILKQSNLTWKTIIKDLQGTPPNQVKPKYIKREYQKRHTNALSIMNNLESGNLDSLLKQTS